MATVEAPLMMRMAELRRLERVLESRGYIVVSRVGLTLVAESKRDVPHCLYVRAMGVTTHFSFLESELGEPLPLANWMRVRVAVLLRHQQGVCIICLTVGGDGCCPTCGLTVSR